MSDPAVRAAERLLGRAGLDILWSSEAPVAVNAAREALQPVREAVENPANRLDDVLTGRPYIALDAIASLLYAAEELANEK